MKYFTVILILAFMPLITKSQELIDWGWPFPPLGTEDSFDYEYVLFDTTEVWQVMKPNKSILFLPTHPYYLNEYAIISDSNAYYANNLKSSFQFKLLVNEDYTYDFYEFSFYHKYDFEENKDGGIIETSYDNGETWQNILFDEEIILEEGYSPNHLYKETDTISSYNNSPGFTGLQSDYIEFYTYFEPSTNIRGDTMLLRFTISSDSVNSNNEGWMIDEFFFSNIQADKIQDISLDNEVIIFPNPTNNNNITVTSKDYNINKIEILDLNGQILKTELLSNIINVADLSSGIYLIRINDKFVQRIVVQ